MSAMPSFLPLAPELEASEPPEARGLARDEGRLLVTEAASGRLTHAPFAELGAFLRPGDLLVVNDSATLPASVPIQGGGRLHLSTPLPGATYDWQRERPGDLWVVEPRQRAVRAGEHLRLPADGHAILLSPYRGSRRLWLASLRVGKPLLAYLHRWGEAIHYGYVPRVWPLDMYQTMFASRPGSAEMPSAARPFTPRVLNGLQARGVEVASLTLHTGVASLEGDEAPYDEFYEVPAATLNSIQAARARKSRVVAIGTTVVRALESAWQSGQGSGWTSLVVTPQRGVAVADAILSGLHEPRATHLMMLAAFCGEMLLRRSYREAVRESYRWHEFGDSHLILRTNQGRTS
jgi:S-adenosylmethionine:tRNA ribosyltransferase-isomerase